MFTLKLHTTVFRQAELDSPTAIDEENDHFIPADEVRAFGAFGRETVPVPEAFAAWVENQLEVERDTTHWQSPDGKTGGTTWEACRLLEVRLRDTTRWILASHAWLLGPNGQTIERIAP